MGAKPTATSTTSTSASKATSMPANGTTPPNPNNNGSFANTGVARRKTIGDTPPARTGKGASRMYGYARVSSRDQNLSRQIDALLDFGLEERFIYQDKASGKDFERPRYQALVKRLQPGDVLVIKSIDRLGRNYEEILEEWRVLTKKRKAAIVVLDMPLLDTRSRPDNVTGVFVADIMLQLLSYIAQIERENTRQRQREGIAAARARGVQFGRPAIAHPKCWPAVRKAYLAGEINRRQASSRLGVSRNTFDRWMKGSQER